MDRDERLTHEMQHGKLITKKGDEIWNWSSPAGRVRWVRRCQLFADFLCNRKKKVLEIGCGTGLFTQEICETDNEIVSIYISADLINLAKNRVRLGSSSLH